MLTEVQQLDSERLVRNLHGSFGSVYDTVVHLYQADLVWLERLEERPNGKREDYASPGCMYDLAEIWLAVIDRMIAFAGVLARAAGNARLDTNRWPALRMKAPSGRWWFM